MPTHRVYLVIATELLVQRRVVLDHLRGLLKKYFRGHCKKFRRAGSPVGVEQPLLTTLQLVLQIGIGLAEHLFPALGVVLRVARRGRWGTLSRPIFLVQLVGKLV